jgi:hypothetical protein
MRRVVVLFAAVLACLLPGSRDSNAGARLHQMLVCSTLRRRVPGCRSPAGDKPSQEVNDAFLGR